MKLTAYVIKFKSWRANMTVKQMISVAFITIGLVASSQAGSFKAADESVSTDLCMAAISGNRAVMHNKVRASGLSLNYITENVQCNGENILSYVQQHGKNSAKMLKVLDRRDVEINIIDIARNSK